MPPLRHVSSARRLLLARFMGSKAKKKGGVFSRSDRGILWGTRAFFITLALLFMSIAWWRAADLKQSIRADVHNWAEVTATQTAGIVAANIDARFYDLAFLRKTFFAQGTDHLLPSAKVLSAFVAFQQTHPAIMAIDVRDPSGNRIVWSSVQQSTRRIAADNDFTPLPGYPDRFMGKPFYAHRAHAWVLTMRQRIRNSEGHVLGFIGCSFMLSHLSVIHTPLYLQSIVLMRPHGQVISIWKDGHWAAPGTPLPRPVGQVVVPVPGYPWALQVQWTAAALDHVFWRVERTRLSILLAALFVLAGVALLLQLLRRILRFRQYQMAAILAQQDLLRQDDPEVMYRRLVAVVVEQTEAIGAYVVVPETNSEWLRVVAASADTPELRQTMEALTPSRDAAHFPYGDMIPSRAFREKTAQGPTRPQQSPAMTVVQQQQAPLSRIRSVMAYPVFVYEDTEPSAVLVIVSDLPRHFTPSLQRLLGQLAATLGLALTQWRQHQALISLEKSLQESSEKNEALLNNASDGIHVLDENGFLIEVNYQFCTMLGYSRAEMLGMHVSQWDAEKSAGELKELIARQFSTAESLRFETRHRCKDGTIIDVEINGSPIQIQGKWVLLDSARDITKRKVLEADLQRSLEHQRKLTDFNVLLGEVNQAITRANDEDSLLQEVCDLIVQYTSSALAWIGRPDAQGDFQVLAAAGETGYLNDIKISSRADIPEGQGTTGMVWRQQKAIYDADFSQNAKALWRERVAHFGFRGSSVLPIRRNGVLWAVCTVYAKGDAKAVETDVRGIMEEMAKDISFGLDHLDAVHRERATQAFNEALLNNLAAGISIVRFPDLVIERVNARMLEIYGASSVEDLVELFAGKNCPDHESSASMATLAQEVLAEGYGALKDLAIKRKDGQIVYVDVSGQRLLTDPKHPVIVWTSMEVTERHHLMGELSRQSLSDLLTGLPNRRALDMEMDRAIAHATRNESLLALCMLDLDSFKPVNDTYGHDAGDQVLRIVAQRLPQSLRKTDFIARIGGDEFVVLVENLDHLDPLEAILDTIGSSISAPITLEDGQLVSIGLSMGVAIYPFAEGDNPDALLRLADQALYESKAHKANREFSWVLFGEETRKIRRTVAQRLLDTGALEIWYQPILDSRTRKVVGVEALSRLRDAEGKVWSPAEFLPQLQEADLFVLSKKVLDQALTDLPILEAQGWSLWVSVNVDPSSISESSTLWLREMVASGKADPSRITLEILEGSDFLEQPAALKHLLELRALGVRLALDDVGSAYSSLLRLKDLPVDEIKLDQGFIRTLEQHPQDLHFVESIQALAVGMGVDLVVEGVETDDILDAVTIMGANFLQGYAIAKPMPLSQLQAFLDPVPLHPQQQPASLLGLYATQLVNHGALKKTICYNPRLVDCATLANATICPIHVDMHRLGIPDDDPLYRLHAEYHQAIAAMNALLLSSPINGDWRVVEQAEKAFEAAILDAFQRSKAAEER